MDNKIKLYSIHDEQFKQYGQVIHCPFTALFEREAQKIEIPATGCSYRASVEAFEQEGAKEYFERYFGEMPAQIGYCWGRNNTLNALEWHKNSEINVALEDMIILLGDQRQMQGDTFDTALIKAFLVKKGEAVEVYQTSLHYCPSMTDGKVFKSVVILPKDTNTALTQPTQDKRLVAKNKWLICHPDCKKLVESGRVVGLKGENITV